MFFLQGPRGPAFVWDRARGMDEQGYYRGRQEK